MSSFARALRVFLTLAAPLALSSPDAAAQDTIPPAPDTTAAGEDEWDVARSFGPTRTIRFETDEATWVNVTVSPDGTTIVFDVLGDLYTMPITGTGSGLARRITSGPGWLAPG